MAISSASSDLNTPVNNFEDKYQQFLSDGKAQSNTFHFWHEYINDIELSLNYVKAEKIPDWQLYLACCADIISCAFAYDHQSYAPFILQKCFFYLKLPKKSMPYSNHENMLFVDLHLDPSIMFGRILVSDKVSLRTQNQEKVELLALVGRSLQL